MCTACGRSHPQGWGEGVCLSACWNTHPPGVGLETILGVGLEIPWVWAWRPLGVGLETPLGVGLETPPGMGLESPPGCGPGDSPWPNPSTYPLGVGLETPPGDLLQGMLGYHLPSCVQNSWHTLLKILPCLNIVVGGKNIPELPSPNSVGSST